MPRQHVEKTKGFWSENEAERANKHANKRIIYWPPFWNKVYEQFSLGLVRYFPLQLAIAIIVLLLDNKRFHQLTVFSLNQIGIIKKKKKTQLGGCLFNLSSDAMAVENLSQRRLRYFFFLLGNIAIDYYTLD